MVGGWRLEWVGNGQGMGLMEGGWTPGISDFSHTRKYCLRTFKTGATLRVMMSLVCDRPPIPLYNQQLNKRLLPDDCNEMTNG